jgi:tetratricopeptide (TPR) repeat protein
MSRETEKALKGMNEFLDKNVKEGMSEDDIQNLMNAYMMQMNSTPGIEVTEKTAKTSDDFLELADKARNDAERLKFIKKALELDPDNYDALLASISISSRDPIDTLKRLKNGVEQANKHMEKEGYLTEDVGHFWGILETRPYMRLREKYADMLAACGMYGKAAQEYEDMIRLNENDNLGCRYALICLYVLLEKEDAALALYKKYDEHDETRILFPLSILYYRLGDFDKAEKYLKRASKINKDTKKFIKAFLKGNLDREIDKIGPYGYRPFTYEEYLAEYMENGFMMEYTRCFFIWAENIL